MTVTREQIIEAIADALYITPGEAAKALDAIHPLGAVVDRSEFELIQTFVPDFLAASDLTSEPK
jgi:hypothetical protein